MATTNDLKNGMVLNIDGQLWAVTEFQHVKPGKGPAFVRTKLRNVESGKNVDKTFNAGAWTHYSLALWDACAQLSAPLVEVHISDPQQRAEEFRHTSVVEPHAVLTIAGQGIDGYRQALAHLAHLAD